MNRILILLLGIAFVGNAAQSAPAPPAPTTNQAPLTREETQHLLSVLQDPEQRARFITTLEEYARAAPLAQAGGTTAAQTPAGTAGKPPPTASAIARALKTISESAALFVLHIGGDFRALTNWSALSAWLDTLLARPDARHEAQQTALRIGLIIALAFAVEMLLRRFRVRTSQPAATVDPAVAVETAGASGQERSLPFGQRVGLAGRQLVRGLIVVVLVGLVGNAAILVALTDFPTGRAVAFGILNAYLGVRLIMGFVTVAFAPSTPAARLVPVDDQAATRASRFARLLAATIAFGYLGGEIAAELGASPEVHESIQKLVALIVHFLLIVMVIRSRRIVATWIRQRFGAGAVGTIGEACARAWPFVAVTGIASWWLVWAMDIPDGYERILRFVLATAAVLIVGQSVASFLLGLIDRRLSPAAGVHPNGLPGRLLSYRRVIRSATQIALMVLTLLVLMETWGIDTFIWFGSGHVGNRVGVLTLKLLLLAVIGIVCWEVADAAVEARVSRLMAESALARATRLRTLQPIVRIALIIVLSLVVVLTALSEIGINVGPLLAGASIFGVALGFGSQKLVQDFITGIFLLVEDAMDVGDSVTVAGLSGTVEHLSIRTIRLRAGDGSVYLIPFSAVTSVNNSNRGIGNAAVSVAIDASEDTDRVAALLDDIVREMRADTAFASSMQSDLQLWGVDKIDGGIVTIAGQIVCTDAGRWAVQREFNRRVKKRLQQENIRLGVPHQRLRIGRMERVAQGRTANDKSAEEFSS